MSSDPTTTNQVLSLDLIQKGESCSVITISSSDKALRTKLLNMGIVPGTVVKVIAVAPLGDPITICALGYSLSLRLSEARQVSVEYKAN